MLRGAEEGSLWGFMGEFQGRSAQIFSPSSPNVLIPVLTGARGPNARLLGALNQFNFCVKNAKASSLKFTV